MATLTVERVEWQIDDELLLQFRSLAGTPTGSVDAATQRRMLDFCGDDRHMLADLVAWLFLEREMSPKEMLPSVKQGCDVKTAHKFAIAASKQRHRHNPAMHRLATVTKVN